MSATMVPISFISEVLGVPPGTVRAWCRKGKVPHVRVGRFFLISVCWLEGMIRKAGGDPAAILTKYGVTLP